MDYAVIRTGGKQYRVAPGDILRVEKLEAEPGARVELREVLVVRSGDEVRVGTPTVPGAAVSLEVLAQEKARKVLVFKKKRRKKYRRRYGHRQPLTRVRVAAIESGANDGA